MKKVLPQLVALAICSGTASAADTSCSFFEPQTDPDTNEPIIKTKWNGVYSKMNMAMAEDMDSKEEPPVTGASVRGISRGDAISLGVMLSVQDYYPIPPELGVSIEDTNMIFQKGIYDDKLDPYIRELREKGLAVAAGSTVKLTFEDRTVLILESAEDVAVQGAVTRPTYGDNNSHHFRLRSEVTLEYPVDEEALKLLMAKPVANMRIETGERYYDLNTGMPGNIIATRFWSKKSYYDIQGVLSCVL
jgi:hypothetical protein